MASSIIWRGLDRATGFVITVIANLMIRTIVVTFFGVPETFRYMQAPFIIDCTIVYLLLALLVFALVSRFAQQPMRFYRILALIALCVSFLFPIMALVGVFPAAGMNLVSAIIVVGLLTTLTREQH